MVNFTCNSTLEYEHVAETKIWHNMEFHHFGLILSALFGLISVLMSCYLIWQHCSHYLKPWEQKHIIRVLFMVPIYSIVSFLSYLFYQHAVYFEVIRDCYEAFAIASFFALLCHYIAPSLPAQKDYFRGIQPRPWVLPVNWFQRCCGGEYGMWRTPRSGLTWFNIIWFGVFQYCFVRVFMTFIALITQATGRYCQESVSPIFAHVWIMVIEGVCVTGAMYCIIQFYLQVRYDLAEHQPFLKVLAIKLVIFLSFWQTLLISFLTSAGAIKSSNKIQSPDIRIGIPSMLLCIEMAIFSVFHLWAFPWKVYDVHRSHIIAAESAPGVNLDPKTAYQGGPFGSRALMDAFNAWDLVKNVGRGFKWIAVDRKTRMQDISYKTPAQGGGLEPTRSQTLNQNLNPFRERHENTELYDGGGGGKPGRYVPLHDHDDERLVSHPLPISHDLTASTAYPRPMERLPHSRGPSGSSIGTVGVYDPPPTTQGNLPHPTTSQPSLQSQDTSYHGARDSHRDSSKLTPVPPPDPHPLGPPGRKSHEAAEWDMWGGVEAGDRENERDLGGGHGVGDNRF